MFTASQAKDPPEMPGKEANSEKVTDAPVPSEELLAYFLQNWSDDGDDYTDIPLLRQQTRKVGLRDRGELEPVASSTDSVLSGVPVRTYRPARLTRPSAGFIWIHGGGWMHGDLDVYDGVARAFANELGCEVIAVDYGLAPEHPFPDGLREVWNVVQWAVANFEDVVVAGDSSGGNLAAAAAIKARDSGVRLAAQLLIYPMLDSSDSTEFKTEYRTRYSPFAGREQFGENTYQRIKWIWDVYVPDPVLRESALATPMRATSLRGVAAAVIITAEHDILRGEAEAYAERLRAADVPVEITDFAGTTHGFLQMRGVLTEASSALKSTAIAVSHHLRPETARTAAPSIARSRSRARTTTKES